MALLTRLLLPLSVVGLTACSTLSSADFKGQQIKAIDGISLSCSAPYELPQDCSNVSGASLVVSLGNKSLKVAGSGDGRIVLLMANVGALTLPSQSELEGLADAAIASAASSGFKLQAIEAVAAGQYVVGYILRFDGDAYGHLKSQARR
jgi:hypothetical protein